MPKERKAEYKPLLFTTTLRNPERIVDFLNILLPHENVVLTNDIILRIIKKLITEKIYTPIYVRRTPRLKAILQDEMQTYNDNDIDEILKNSPQQHKEAGFDKGWASRFDTMFKFAMELGFVFYEIDKPLIISNAGHMIIDAYNEETPNGEKIQNVFLNAMMKYQTNNPFRKIKNENAPLILLLQVIKLLKNNSTENNAGIARREIPLFICWTDNNADELYKEIKSLREKYGYEYSDEIVYDICLRKMGATEKDKKRFKMGKIIHESVDEFIRKMRITGVISLRGMGRFIDFNSFEIEKINYILDNYLKYDKYTTKKEYFEYIGKIDSRILSLPKADVNDIDTVRRNALVKWATHYDENTILNELAKLSGKRDSTDDILREISAPTRLEFLTAIALKQQFEGLDVRPNYKIDDEGLPTFTASGGMADIECFDLDSNSLFEVTLMCSRNQATNEMPAITRHLQEAVLNYRDKFVFSVLVAPSIHADTKYMADFSKHQYNVDILTLTINEFVTQIQEKDKVKDMLA